jgi:fructoselysine-6-P-deglycase FrlB-like protein
MSAIAHEVASQPDVWQRASDLAPGLPLPAHGLRLAVAGCGTSLYMAQAYAAAREQAGAGETDAFAASEFPSGRSYDALLVISRSGTTTEVIHLLKSQRDTPTVALTAVPDSPIAALAGTVVSLPFADERSVVQTRFALMVLLTHAGLDMTPSIGAARRVLEAELPLDPGSVSRFQFLGHGWTNGLASEAALKLREAAQAWAESYPAMEYRHGPISLADAGTAVIPIGPIDDSLVADITSTGANLVDPDASPLATLVLAHRLAMRLAELRGLDPDLPRNLTRSVVLP